MAGPVGFYELGNGSPGKTTIGAGGQSLESQIRNWISALYTQKLPMILQEVTRRLFVQIVERSPVDTGRFVSFWDIRVGDAAGAYQRVYFSYKGKTFRSKTYTKTTQGLDFGGEGAKQKKVAEVNRRIAALGPGVTRVSISNSLPYARPLEYGWSATQAPNGIVRVVMHKGNVQRVIADVIQQYRGK